MTARLTWKPLFGTHTCWPDSSSSSTSVESVSPTKPNGVDVPLQQDGRQAQAAAETTTPVCEAVESSPSEQLGWNVVTSAKPKSLVRSTFGGVYKLDKVLGEGKHGKVWSAHDDGGKPLAIKVYYDEEDAQVEAEVYATLWKQMPSLCGFARFHDLVNDDATCETGLVLDYVGIDLDTLFGQSACQWSISTVARIWIMLISRIKAVHRCGYVLRYIKGANLCMGGENHGVLHIVDLAGASRYLDSQGNHLPCQEGRTPTGSSAYRAKNSDNGLTPSRRDDMESAGYAMLCFVDGGKLPWSRSSTLHSPQSRRHPNVKHSTSLERLSCGYKPIGEYFGECVKVARCSGCSSH